MVKCEISLNKSLFFIFQEKMLDMESDLEELHDSEQRWAAKHKRAIEQVNHSLLPNQLIPTSSVCRSVFSGRNGTFLFSLLDRAAADEVHPGERSE